MRDFFERQGAARRNTLLLTLYFLAGVALLTAVVSVALYVLLTFNFNWRSWNHDAIGRIAAAVLVLVVCGTIYKYLRLRSGGGSLIAEMLGGRLVYPDTRDLHERRLLNIVEEMAIASGITVPSVYLLAEEKAINAFAAGFAREDAVLGVTWGALHYLSRDELQGVVAHEFSHILSGDMLINIRLQGLLHGILLLGLLGEFILRNSGRTSGRGRGGALTVGLVLYILGYSGVFAGKLLKSAIARQREFLADASAVQFTRNPLGLAGALKKIGGLGEGSRVRSPHAAEISHMYFGNGMAESWFNALSTHPPLLERIRRLDPEFKTAYPEHLEPVPVEREEALVYAAAPSRPAHKLPAGTAALATSASGPTAEHLQRARRLIGRLPHEVQQAARDGFGARAVIYGLLLDGRQEVRQEQLACLAGVADQPVRQELDKLLPLLAVLPPELRFPLAELALPSLKTLSPRQYTDFRRNVKTMVECDGRIDLFEYCLSFFLTSHLQATFGRGDKEAGPVKPAAGLRVDISRVLSTLARYGHDGESAARRALMQAVRQFAERDRKYIEFLPARDDSLKRFDQALRRLGSADASLKKKLLAACLTCITWDRKITVQEAELYRVLSLTLGSPVPAWLQAELAGTDATHERDRYREAKETTG